MAEFEHLIPFGFIGLFIFIAVVAVGRHYYREKKRRQALADEAYHLGLEFVPDADLGGSEFARCQLFNQGHARSFFNVMHGEAHGRELYVFDYKYTTGSGKNSSTHRQTVAAYLAGKDDLPQFELRPEHFFHKIGSLFGYQDIDFGTNPGFSKSYLLRGKDERDVRGVFRQDVLYHFESKPGWCVESSGRWLVIYRSSKRVDPEQMRAFVDDADTIVSIFPL